MIVLNTFIDPPIYLLPTQLPLIFSGEILVVLLRVCNYNLHLNNIIIINMICVLPEWLIQGIHLFLLLSSHNERWNV